MAETLHKIPVILIGGCTASGKSDVALQFARCYPSVIINADSMQIYKELPVLTAQPTRKDQETCFHKLYSALDGNDICSVARWQELALQEIHSCRQENKLPLVVGGSGLYLRSLTQGLSQIPPIDPAVRENARMLYRKWGALKFYQQLQDLDPLMAKRLHPSDKQRVVRAWEVMESSNISLAIWQKKLDTSTIKNLDCRMIVLDPLRDAVKQRANIRLKKMFDSGAVEEVQALNALGYDLELPVMKALGVPEICTYLAGKITLKDALEQIEIGTRQYVKRQSTWFRNQFKNKAVYTSCISQEAISQHLKDFGIKADF